MKWKFEGLNTEYISENPELTAVKLRKINNLKEDHKIIIINEHIITDDDFFNSNGNISEQPTIQMDNKKSKNKL